MPLVISDDDNGAGPGTGGGPNVRSLDCSQLQLC